MKNQSPSHYITAENQTTNINTAVLDGANYGSLRKIKQDKGTGESEERSHVANVVRKSSEDKVTSKQRPKQKEVGDQVLRLLREGRSR